MLKRPSIFNERVLWKPKNQSHVFLKLHNFAVEYFERIVCWFEPLSKVIKILVRVHDCLIIKVKSVVSIKIGPELLKRQREHIRLDQGGEAINQRRVLEQCQHF